MDGSVRSDWALQLIRDQRHSLLNGLQVVLGWLQMNRPERAQEHLQKVLNRLAAEMELTRKVSPEAALQVCALMLEAETYDVALRWQVAPAGEDQSPTAKTITLDEAYAQLRARTGGSLTLRITTDGRLSVHNVAGEGKG